jgi:hypothetical protein
MMKRSQKIMSRTRIGTFAVATLVICAGSAAAQVAPQQASPATTTALEQSRQAIIECRERRLRHELETYKQSAECSSPKIFAAWQAANYPHMDLITAWLTAREDASAQVDQKALTPKQFEAQMEALTIRLTAEEARRRSGLVATADNALQLQLPQGADVVAVATPRGQEKQAAKKTAAARARAAAVGQSAEPASNAGVATMGTLSPLDNQKRSAAGGVGGPFVPVDPNSPAARAAMARAAAASAPGAGSSGLYAHLASQHSEADARTAFRALQSQYPNLLGGRDAVIRRTTDSDQQTYYRVEVGPFTQGQADEFCGGLKSAGAQCVARYE